VTSETIPLSLVWSRIPEHFGGEPGDQTLDRAQAIVSSNLTGPTTKVIHELRSTRRFGSISVFSNGVGD